MDDLNEYDGLSKMLDEIRDRSKLKNEVLPSDFKPPDCKKRKITKTCKKREILLDPKKTPVQQLNELFPNPKFTVLNSSGPSHNPVFSIELKINEKIYKASAGNKKQAKHKAAQLALKDIISLKLKEIKLAKSFKLTEEESIDFKIPEATETNDTLKHKKNSSYIGKNPIQILNELKPDTIFIQDFDNKSANVKNPTKFKISIKIDNKTFTGEAHSKKLAKSRAAQRALTTIYKMEFENTASGTEHAICKSTTIQSNITPEFVETKQYRHADFIANLVNNKFLTVATDPTELKRKVLAGIVMIRKFSNDSTEDIYDVITVTTGNKCLSGMYMSTKGRSIHDCHAEILAIRALRRFLWERLIKIKSKEKDEFDILEQLDSKCYGLKKGVDFHLYISTSPCGDARIFAPYEPSDGGGDGCNNLGDDDKHPQRQNRGLLRSKIENGEGTIPVKDNVMQTWDGIIGGERLLTMSCSDKLMKTTVLGIQGSLLTLILKPIFFTSIIIGSLFHSNHMERAIYGRIPNNLVVKSPIVSGITSSEIRKTAESPNYAFVWCIDNYKEVIQAASGKLQDGGTSKLSKIELFSLCKSVWGLGLTMFLSFKNVYSEAKELALDYKHKKTELIKAIKENNGSNWATKPLETNSFIL